jgi:hypothetical protein
MINGNVLYCTVAIGDEYLDSAKKILETLNNVSNTHHMLIVTDKEELPLKNATFEKVSEKHILFIRNGFNYMMKHYPLYLSRKLGYNHIIFIDADWRVTKNYDESKIKLMTQYMDENNFDMLFERPHGIGLGKHQGISCFWQHKIDFYKLKETDEYDNGHVCNEQFMVFKNNEKFDLFVNKFKELYEVSSKEELWPFAEGLEIGMSMAYSKMKYDWLGWGYYLKGMFEFNSKNGGLNIRF